VCKGYLKTHGPYAFFKGKSLGRVFLEKEVNTLRSLLEVLITHNIRTVYVLFSGGRDSLVTLDLSRRASKALDVSVYAVHVDTTISTPGNLEYVKETCQRLRVKLIVLRPKENFFKLVEKWGFPTATRRWCCYHLKLEPLKRFFSSLNHVALGKTLIVDGIRAEESPRRRTFPKLGFHRHFKCLCYHPIFEWTDYDVRIYISQHKLKENPLYKILPRATECWCTAFKTADQFKLLKRYFPELFEKFVEAEKKLKNGGSALFRHGRKIYLRDL